MPYNERLTLLNQSSLLLFRTRTDLILLYRILHGLVNSESKAYLFSMIIVGLHDLHGHAFKLNTSWPRTDLLKYNTMYIELVNV